ncbi:protein of unknown function (DUF222) [Promicromonospora umidemergens]|uniref:HNH nuclease domain-containing protein n=1 Tax=Promicromonospora umidemergens TaxID=629679 RepID=A0ABP8XXY6_9MICO|nr:HNH endonuclease signature motif containing protein [Promicromonospora umidemergens]MCP2286191.1 protein of unknown function (DUF222) [Promicromonospora umidemergens]
MGDDANRGAAQGAGLASVVERRLRPLITGSPAAPPAGARTTTMGPVLSWGAVALAAEGALPAATVTWLDHDHARTAATATPAAAGAAVAGADAADDLGTVPVGAGLVDVLAGVNVALTEDAALLDVAARWQEVVTWATAMQSRALGEIARRRGWTEEHNAAAAEISARLRVPQGEANKHLARGAGLAEHPQVMTALHDGLIDTAKADILLRSGNPLTVEEREAAITLYLPEAPDHSRRWLRERMNAFATRLKGATETTRHALARRAVFLDPADNSMAWLSANLPATDAAAVWDAIDTTAHILRRTPGATRTLSQARADALVAITTGRIIVPPEPECAPAAPTDDLKPAEPATAEPAADEPAPEGPAAGLPVSPASPEPALPRTTVPAVGCTCGGCTCGGTAVRVIPVKPQIRVTIAATTLLGLDNLPGHLDGYGPIPADVAARIAADATWQRLVTDPVTGILTDHSTTTYQPGRLLRQAVTARDQTCAFPQCDRPARWSDLDHIDPFDHDLDATTLPLGTPGQTRATNLQPLCRAHHLAKTHHGWNPVRDPGTGITTWTAPTGHRYLRPATQIGQVSNDTTSLVDDTRARLGQPPLDERPSATRPATGQSTTAQSSTAQSSTAQPTTEQQLRRFSDDPPF